MDPKIESPETHQTPEVVSVPAAELAELRKKAEVSEQNFARLKKEEQAKAELEAKLAEKGEPVKFDPAALKKEVDDKVSLRLSGHTPEMIEEIERYAKGANIGLLEASKAPFVMKAVEALSAEQKSLNSTPAPSSKIKVFNGKPVEEIFKSGSDAEKQAAFEARLRGGGKSNE